MNVAQMVNHDFHPQTNHPVFIMVFGLGCETLTAEQILAIREEYAGYTDLPLTNILILCHKTTSALRCIVSTYLKYVPLKKSQFIHRWSSTIKTLLANHSKVIIFGHSFGGAIVNRIAQEINSDNEVTPQLLTRLHCATFGSIYVAPEPSIERIKIINYMSLSDVAMKCNQLVPLTLPELESVLWAEFNTSGILIICRFTKHSTTSVKYICLHEIDKENAPLCTRAIRVANWNEHNEYFTLISTLMEMQIADLMEIENTRMSRMKTAFIDSLETIENGRRAQTHNLLS